MHWRIGRCAAARARGETQHRSARALHECAAARPLVHRTNRNPACGRANLRVLIFAAALAKKFSGSRPMDLFTVVIIVTMLVTVAAMFLGVLTMSGGGSTDKSFSTPLMWARVGFQALTLLLLFIAIRLR
jgi:hypothetical protein